MPARLTIKDIATEAALFRSRVVVAAGIVAVLTVVLLARMVHLQVFEHDHFRTLSHNNRVRIVPLAPTRGLIYDRNGVILAENTPSFSLEVVPEAVRDMDATLDALGDIVAFDDSDLDRFRRLAAKNRHRRFDSVVLRSRLSEDEVARFAVSRHRFPGVDIHARLTRHYPLDALGVHAVGYVARINEEELHRLDPVNYRATSFIGKTGVEREYEDILHGRVGHQHEETNAQGRRLRVLQGKIHPIPGHNLYLSLDASLQAVAEAALGEEAGAVVAIDPDTGGVLAMASTPSYDPNLFVHGVDARTYDALRSSLSRPLFNRVLAGRYPPGSTIKPFVALAGLVNNAEQMHKESWCPGWYQLKGREHKYRDWKKHGHGRVDMEAAIVESCDVYFYELALALGIDRMHQFLSSFGFGVRTGVDLPVESSGLLPSSAWKRRARNQPWYPGETLITGIGQGFTLVTPMQLASVTATLGMRGLRLQPRLVHRIVEPTGTTRVLPPTPVATIQVGDSHHWERVIHAMIDVVHGPRGTARRVGHGAAYRMAGKTGTAQVVAVAQDETYDEEAIAKKHRDHSLFVAFAPAESPRIAVAVVVENGGSGSRTAAPMARKVLDHYLLNRGERRPRGRLIMTALTPGSPTNGQHAHAAAVGH